MNGKCKKKFVKCLNYFKLEKDNKHVQHPDSSYVCMLCTRYYIPFHYFKVYFFLHAK